jgi:lipopolysaccharide transport system ATP-binding protein
MSPIIEAEGLSKRFLIHKGRSGLPTLRESIVTCFRPSRKQEFWALKDVSFSIYQGDTMGVIGENGAGKTTLLKVLSKITNPTRGRGVIRGRVGSLLEVGTGFHPELSGKENIYLNGVILNLSKKEIDRKFDEIVEFAGVSQFLETPIKHYSTGMWARLAFSVAAHLDPEILLIDEVLSVGDTEFQKKSLDKMNDLSSHGRTVLFVSHNMAAIRKLCSRCMLFSHGELKMIGETNDVVNAYLDTYNHATGGLIDLTGVVSRKGSGQARLETIELRNQNNEIAGTFSIKDDLSIHLFFTVHEFIKAVKIIVEIKDAGGGPICEMYDSDCGFRIRDVKGDKHVSLTLKDIRFYPGKYYLTVSLSSEIMNYKYDTYDEVAFAASFTIINQIVMDRSLANSSGLLYLTPDWMLH